MGVKCAGDEVDHLSVSSTEIKNERSYASSPAICLMVQTGTNLPFTLLLLD